MSAVQLPSELLSDRAYAALRDRLVDLQIAPGAPIDEDALTRELGVGRTPVREAIRRLALEGLVVVYPRRGTFATAINITSLSDITDVRVQHFGPVRDRPGGPAPVQDGQPVAELDGPFRRRGADDAGAADEEDAPRRHRIGNRRGYHA